MLGAAVPALITPRRIQPLTPLLLQLTVRLCRRVLCKCKRKYKKVFSSECFHPCQFLVCDGEAVHESVCGLGRWKGQLSAPLKRMINTLQSKWHKRCTLHTLTTPHTGNRFAAVKSISYNTLYSRSEADWGWNNRILHIFYCPILLLMHCFIWKVLLSRAFLQPLNQTGSWMMRRWNNNSVWRFIVNIFSLIHLKQASLLFASLFFKAESLDHDEH